MIGHVGGEHERFQLCLQCRHRRRVEVLKDTCLSEDAQSRATVVVLQYRRVLNTDMVHIELYVKVYMYTSCVQSACTCSC